MRPRQPIRIALSLGQLDALIEQDLGLVEAAQHPERVSRCSGSENLHPPISRGVGFATDLECEVRVRGEVPGTPVDPGELIRRQERAF